MAVADPSDLHVIKKKCHAASLDSCEASENVQIVVGAKGLKMLDSSDKDF